MIDYTLAKSLKEAEFPQECRAGDRYWWDTGKERKIVGFPLTVKSTPYLRHWQYKLPTLSELITQCGAHFKHLHRHQERYRPSAGRWSAKWRDMNGKEYTVWGKTPEEAVANLYLALKEKK